MKINDESNVCVKIPFSVSETNETKNQNLFYIITENMRINLMKKKYKTIFYRYFIQMYTFWYVKL